MQIFEIISRQPSFRLEVPTSARGVLVADIQKFLKKSGFDLGNYGINKDGVDGIRGPKTTEAVKQFQAKNSLPTTGVPDQRTVSAMNKRIADNPMLYASLTKSSEQELARPARTNPKNMDLSKIHSEDFNKKLKNIAAELGVSDRDLMAIMRQESSMDHRAVNRHSGATGLIQFMPKTAAALGTTTEDLRNMSAVEQLDYVYKYFKMVGVRPGMDLGDLYLAVFYPAALGKGDSFVIGRSGAAGFSGKVYQQNRGLDMNRDGVITAADAKRAVQRYA
jgi:hypothetical protein